MTWQTSCLAISTVERHLSGRSLTTWSATQDSKIDGDCFELSRSVPHSMLWIAGIEFNSVEEFDHQTLTSTAGPPELSAKTAKSARV
jgi:hypothetical protein